MADTMTNEVTWRIFDRANCPSVKIKNYDTIWDQRYPFNIYDISNPHITNMTDEKFDANWIQKNVDSSELVKYEHFVSHFAIRRCEDFAKELFGDKVDLIQDGRMGGWLVLSNWKSFPDRNSYWYEPEDEWSEKDFKKWIDFENFVKNQNENFITMLLSEIYIDFFIGRDSWEIICGE